jgi:hypothetical protein
VGSLVMGCIVDRSCVHRPRPPLRAEDRRLTDKRPVDPRPLRVAVDPATRHAVADLNVATYYLAGRRHSDRYQADPLQRLRFRSNRHRHVRRGFGGAPMRHPVDSGLSTRGTRGGGFVVWTADDDDSWRTMTWSAAVVICVGSVLAVFGLLPLSVHGPLHFYGVMDPLCGATRAVRLALRGGRCAACCAERAPAGSGRGGPVLGSLDHRESAPVSNGDTHPRRHRAAACRRARGEPADALCAADGERVGQGPPRCPALLARPSRRGFIESSSNEAGWGRSVTDTYLATLCKLAPRMCAASSAAWGLPAGLDRPRGASPAQRSRARPGAALDQRTHVA